MAEQEGAGSAYAVGGAGDPRSLDANLYWGALYGAERYLGRAKGFRVVRRTDAPDPQQPALLRVVVVERAAVGGDRAVRLTLEAWDGERIDDALAQLRRAFPVSAPSIDDFAVTEPTDYPDSDGQAYAGIQSAYITPIDQAYALCLRIGTAIANHFGAHG
jgi:hypothetical protein